MKTSATENARVAGEQPTAPKKFRVQLDFEANDFRMINKLVEELGLGTRAELFRSGLRVLRWMLQKRNQGCVIVAITPDQRYIEPEFDFFGENSSLSYRAPAAATAPRTVTEDEEVQEPVHA